MKTYQLNDPVTFYFVVSSDVNVGKGMQIKAWTDDKDLLSFYMEFHNCSRYTIRKINKTFKEIINIINTDCPNDEITIAYLLTRNKSDKKSSDPTKSVAVPATENELSIVRDSQTSGCAPLINYTLIHDALPKFKKKYQQVFRELGLYDLVGKELYNQTTEFTELLQIDELMLMFRAFPDEFG